MWLFALVGTVSMILAYGGKTPVLVSPMAVQARVEPTMTPTPTPQPLRLRMENYLCYKKDWDCERAKKIIKCESGWNPKAVNGNKNGSVDVGLMQINTIHKADTERLFDYEYNIDKGYEIYLRAGKSFRPWVCLRKI